MEVRLTCPVLWCGPLLHLLNEEVEHLCLYELLYESACAFRLDSFTEIPLLELAPLVVPHDVLCEVAHGLDKERQKSFRDDFVQLLKTCDDDKLKTYIASSLKTR